MSLEMYLAIVLGGGCLFAWYGSARCKHCHKMRLDGHATACPRFTRRNVRFY